eukprot:9215470-Alexandrium_andersonii.AAC.1
MSASLVGSEMCIRDRLEWPGQLSSEQCEAAAFQIQAGPIGHSLPRVVSVSYTHLTLPTICSV